MKKLKELLQLLYVFMRDTETDLTCDRGYPDVLQGINMDYETSQVFNGMCNSIKKMNFRGLIENEEEYELTKFIESKRNEAKKNIPPGSENGFAYWWNPVHRASRIDWILKEIDKL